jgi:hypothetical protein
MISKKWTKRLFTVAVFFLAVGFLCALDGIWSGSIKSGLTAGLFFTMSWIVGFPTLVMGDWYDY